MSDEELLKHAEDTLRLSTEKGKEIGIKGMNTLVNSSIAASLLVIARNSLPLTDQEKLIRRHGNRYDPVSRTIVD